MAPERGQWRQGGAVAGAAAVIQADGGAVAAVGRHPVPVLLLLQLLGLVEVAEAAVLYLDVARGELGCAQLE